MPQPPPLCPIPLTEQCPSPPRPLFTNNYWTSHAPVYPPTPFWDDPPSRQATDSEAAPDHRQRQGYAIVSAGYEEISDYFLKATCRTGCDEVTVHDLTAEVDCDFRTGTSINLRRFLAPGTDLYVINQHYKPADDIEYWICYLNPPCDPCWDADGNWPQTWNDVIGLSLQPGNMDIVTMVGSPTDPNHWARFLNASDAERENSILVVPSISINAWGPPQWDQQVQLNKELATKGAIVACTTWSFDENWGGAQPCSNADEASPDHFDPVVVDTAEHSVAAPLVAFAASLIKQAKPSSTPAQIRDYLYQGMVERPASRPGWKSLYIPCALNAAGIQRWGGTRPRAGVECPVAPVYVSGEPLTECPSESSCPPPDDCDAAACDDGDPCTNDACDLERGCLHLAASGAACDDGDPCTYGDRCVDGACGGSPIACESDECAQRSCNGTAECAEVPLGAAVYEWFDNGWTYGYAGQGAVAFRVPVQDKALYLLTSPAQPDKMQSADISEANTCDWCLCAMDCAYTYSGSSVLVAAAPAPGLVPLGRWVKPTPSVTHRSALASPGEGWGQDNVLGYVCAP